MEYNVVVNSEKLIVTTKCLML